MKPLLPYRSKDINEGSAIDLDLTHLDKAKSLQVPTTLKYRVDDFTHNRQVLDWTIVSAPGSTNTLTITGAQNALFQRGSKEQKMQATVKTVSSSGDILQEDFYYNIIRIFQRQDQVDA